MEQRVQTGLIRFPRLRAVYRRHREAFRAEELLRSAEELVVVELVSGIEGLEQTVLDGKWTFDYLKELTVGKAVSSSVNGLTSRYPRKNSRAILSDISSVSSVP